MLSTSQPRHHGHPSRTVHSRHHLAMASPGEEWSADANEVLEISLIVPGDEKPKEIVKFHPKFTYPIFGESEAIYGYKGLKIRLRFAAHDLTPCLGVTWDKKVKPVGDVEAEDVEEKMKESLPEG